MSKFKILNQMNQVVIDNLSVDEATRYAYRYMKMYPSFTHKDGKFYAGDCKKKNLRLKIQVMS